MTTHRNGRQDILKRKIINSGQEQDVDKYFKSVLNTILFWTPRLSSYTGKSHRIEFIIYIQVLDTYNLSYIFNSFVKLPSEVLWSACDCDQVICHIITGYLIGG